MATKKNIIIGAAQIFLGPSGTTKPAYVSGTSYRTTMTSTPATTAGWKECGYTQNGLEVTNDPTYDSVEVDQLLDTPKMFKTGQSYTIATTFAEATLENLLIAWGQQTSSLSSVAAFENELALEAGALGQAPVERGFVAIGNAVEKADPSNSYGERIYHAFRVLSIESSAFTLARAEATTIPVTFRALPDDDTQRYGSIRDRLNV